MMIWQMQPRRLVARQPGRVNFPCDLEIEVRFQPEVQFGGKVDKSQFMVVGSQCQTVWNDLRGVGYWKNDPGFPALNLETMLGDWDLVWRGNRLVVSKDQVDQDGLDQMVFILYFMLPRYLAHGLDHAPVIESLKVVLPEAELYYAYMGHMRSGFVYGDEGPARQFEHGLTALQHALEGGHYRLTASMYYLSVAHRLRDAGGSDYEFLAEVLLNLAKSIEVLFGTDRDQIRQALSSLGYSTDQVEEHFIPLILLRNDLDVAHVRMASIDPEDRVHLYSFAGYAMSWIRDMLDRVVGQSIDGKTDIPAYTMRRDQSAAMKRLIDTIKRGCKGVPGQRAFLARE